MALDMGQKEKTKQSSEWSWCECASGVGEHVDGTEPCFAQRRFLAAGDTQHLQVGTAPPSSLIPTVPWARLSQTDVSPLDCPFPMSRQPQEDKGSLQKNPKPPNADMQLDHRELAATNACSRVRRKLGEEMWKSFQKELNKQHICLLLEKTNLQREKPGTMPAGVPPGTSLPLSVTLKYTVTGYTVQPVQYG
ncbi:hypothetical protein H920_16381 [Fukomys damarensis]|uniref:Uncharacterized protein n=1 Tax=Fukomys damarensis TaxID=885580 RepID=A0A091CUR9_FUKDA|nr:hypothetical protein H920_16381 [Fukomys damarensis]